MAAESPSNLNAARTSYLGAINAGCRMLDMILIATVVASFALTLIYVLACEKM